MIQVGKVVGGEIILFTLWENLLFVNERLKIGIKFPILELEKMRITKPWDNLHPFIVISQ